MIKLKIAHKAFSKELSQIQSRYSSLLNTKYLLEEIELCERFIDNHQDFGDAQYKNINITSPIILANSARLLLLNGATNIYKHKSLPLFHGWSILNIKRAIKLNQSIPNKVRSSYEQFEYYRQQLGALHKELEVDID
ncbi:hypothetical protein G6Z92_06470 [Vibrio aestuarianus subsp. cardii]|uniref:hypothetical protein n=1 Tax=Vibrio aestuarianus TaxID=28171 RepID=UPI0015C54D5F|nr:hypothetical protein [Vibrio aestuarianus]NGZ66630.1 hypothetical protein [Vibrio aestuarianus subsp. cardii]